jgi:hypothetical protein
LGGVFIIGSEEEGEALVYWELKVEEHRGGEENTPWKVQRVKCVVSWLTNYGFFPMGV